MSDLAMPAIRSSPLEHLVDLERHIQSLVDSSRKTVSHQLIS